MGNSGHYYALLVILNTSHSLNKPSLKQNKQLTLHLKYLTKEMCSSRSFASSQGRPTSKTLSILKLFALKNLHYFLLEVSLLCKCGASTHKDRTVGMEQENTAPASLPSASSLHAALLPATTLPSHARWYVPPLYCSTCGKGTEGWLKS